MSEKAQSGQTSGPGFAAPQGTRENSGGDVSPRMGDNKDGQPQSDNRGKDQG